MRNKGIPTSEKILDHGYIDVWYKLYLVNKSLPATVIPADNVRGCEIVQKMNIWPRSEASRASEILRAISQPRTLSADIPASRKEVYLFYNPPINFFRN